MARQRALAQHAAANAVAMGATAALTGGPGNARRAEQQPSTARAEPDAVQQLATLACVDERNQASDDVTRLNADPSLNPVYDGLNHTGLSMADRAQLMLNYRNSQLAEADLLVLNAMRNNRSDMPVHASGDHPGMQVPLYGRLAADPQQQALMTGLTDRILATDQNALDIEQIFEGVRAQAVELAGEQGPTAETNLAALQAMATLVNYYKFEGGPPQEILDQLPEGLWDRIHQAGEHLSYGSSPDAAVMSHGVPVGPGQGNFTADRNFHFFSHAYLSANLQHEHGVSANSAEATSGYVGAQYELRDGSFRENQGNSGLKDILVNAEGAAFGTKLLTDPCAPLPDQDDGPAVEDRSIGHVAPEDVPTDAQAILDEANDLGPANLLGHALRGVFGIQDGVQIPEHPETGTVGNGHTPPSLSH